MDITKEELVKILDKYLFGWAYKDIERASIYGDAKLAGFILGACFIDAMAGYYCGVTKKICRKDVGERFKKFAKKYLSQYRSDDLYYSLRCGLVHNYAEQGKYVFTDNNKDGFHFEETDRGTLLNLEDFCADLRGAYAKLRKDILKGGKIFKNAQTRLKELGIMGNVQVKKA
jgi:hypothetical protein